MFIGTIQETIPLWSQRWKQGPFVRGGVMEAYRAGTTQRTLHGYRCEHCGNEHHVIGQATEPFFCDCHRLIGITPAPVES